MSAPKTKSVEESGVLTIPNHYAARLSALDMEMVQHVPPGGNWKNIPESVPSKRLEQIRVSYAAGGGSRSTYYGRLLRNAPAYTINTYFVRPGNGCHLHYDYEGGQNRTLSHREAARLQSFPDSFVFRGNLTTIPQQIGNAVPPLLAYQIALSFPFTGQFVDLFSGAGGLALGFVWAGWEPIIANDIEKDFLATYAENIHKTVVLGDIRDSEIYRKVVQQVAKARSNNKPLFILGGPPCQGFSTAGNRRSITDERNWLFQQYKSLIDEIKPDGFIFENVTGLLNMEGGAVFEMVKNQLSTSAAHLSFWKLQAEEYAIPQRRTRIFLIGDCNRFAILKSPPKLTMLVSPKGQLSLGILPPAISVEQALSDLPPLTAGQDGSHEAYIMPPSTLYQQLMRSIITPQEYLEEIKLNHPATPLHTEDCSTGREVVQQQSPLPTLNAS